MSGYRLFQFIRSALMLVVIVLIGFIVCVSAIVKEVSLERSYHQRYGDDWQAQYEKTFGPVSRARGGVTAAGIAVAAIPSLSFWIFRLMTAKQYDSGKKKRPQKRMSNTERVMRARSKALLYNYLGLGGIAVALLLVIFRWGIFVQHADEVVLGMFVFCAGYCSLISGCWWWLQAKAWSEGVVFIGVAPLFIVFIPFVRIIFFTTPALLFSGMVMMPLILLVVVLVLPDKSGVNRKRAQWSYRDIEQKREAD